MSDLLAAAAQSMNVPDPLVERSARAWADATDSSYEEVLTAWAGGETVAAASAAEPAVEEEAEEAAPETAAAPAPQPAAEPAATAAPAQPAPVPTAAAVAVEPEPEEAVEPLPLAARVRMAGRIGAWTGATLGLMGFVLASAWLLSAASLAGEEGAFSPAVQVLPSRVVLGVTLLSLVFGVVVASLSRSAAGWIEPGARLEGRPVTTVVLGAILGLVLGVAAGAVMVSAFSEPVEGSEGMAMMRVVPSLILVLIGGAVLGWVTAALVQLVGVPAGIDEEAAREIQDVRERLSAAVSIPVAAIVLLAILVIPLGLVFIRSNEMASGGAALLAIFAAASILGVATLSASRPTMRISFGEFMVAVAGIATVVIIAVSVFTSMAEPEEDTGEAPTEETVATTVPEGGTTSSSAPGAYLRLVRPV